MTPLTLLAALLGTLPASRRATFWWLPRDGRDNASSLALAAAELASHGVTDVIVYCQFVLGPNATLYVNASDIGRGSRALCPDALRAARARGLGVQLMLGTTQADKSLRNASWVAAACASCQIPLPQPLGAAMCPRRRLLYLVRALFPSRRT